MAATLAEMFGLDELRVRTPPEIGDIDLPAPRVAAPPALASICTSDPYERAGHTYGKSFRDVVRGFARDFRHPPDVVALPRDERDVTALLDWCASAGAATIPYGGGSSVVGGVEADVGDEYSGAVTIDLRRLDRVVEIDTASRAHVFKAACTGRRSRTSFARTA